MSAPDLRAAPFHLDDSAVGWVEATLAGMSVGQKVGQIMCVYLLGDDVDAWRANLARHGIEPGGILMTMRTPEAALRDSRRLQEASAVPMLVAGNLESGTVNFLAGTQAFANPMQLGATRDPAHARRLAVHCARAADASGVNWAFAPVIDLTVNPRNPITNTRAFGRDPELVSDLGTAYIRELEERGIPTSPKHFPGDGVDDRDQHLCTTNNDFGVEEWWDQYGLVYARAIEAGARTVMVGHIRQRALSELELGPLDPGDVMPASLAPELIEGVLRAGLGFNGLVVTDNTAMAAFTTVMPRAQGIVRAVVAGNDMLLGNVDVVRDFDALVAAVDDGSLPLSRLDDAVRRVLATKASVGLHRRWDRAGRHTPDPVEEDGWRRDAARAAVTVTKNTAGILPLAATPGTRVLLYTVGDEPTFYDPTPSLSARFVDGLRARGAEVEVRPIPGSGTTIPEADRLHERFDLCIYYADLRFVGNTNGVRVHWTPAQGPDLPRHVATLPTVLVSIADPYLLQDVPMIRAAINAYTPGPAAVDAALEALYGEIEPQGVAPADPFAGKWDAAV